MPSELATMRIDKWLWAARFFKTRSLALAAIENGRVKLDGQRVKPAREVRPGDRLAIRIGEHEWLLTIRGLSMQRGPAPVAQRLYEEDADSHARRQQQVAIEVSTFIPLLRILFESGMAVEQALRVLSQEARQLLPVLTGELRLVLARVESGLELLQRELGGRKIAEFDTE